MVLTKKIITELKPQVWVRILTFRKVEMLGFHQFFFFEKFVEKVDLNFFYY